MSADYYCYAEVKRDGVWHALGGLYYHEESGEYKLPTTFYSGSRSYFSRTYDKLEEIGTKIKASNVSKEVLAAESWLEADGEYSDVLVVPFQTFKDAIPNTKRHQYSGWVHKNDIWNYEMEQNEIYEHLSSDEYDKLTSAKQKEYEFYEWDDHMDWYYNFKEILNRIHFQIGQYMDVNNAWKVPDNIRLVCIASY